MANNLNVAMEPTKANSSLSQVNVMRFPSCLMNCWEKRDEWWVKECPGSIYVDLGMLGLAKKCVKMWNVFLLEIQVAEDH